jgi:hypothetical protein
MPAKRAAVNANSTQPTIATVTGATTLAHSTPTNANGIAKTVCGNFTKLARRTSNDSPVIS